jgi:GntR family transcriptional regulator
MRPAGMDQHSTEDISDPVWPPAPRENLVTRVANAIRYQVESGQLARGVQLRGEVEFARELGVSRPTLREATRMLTREGLLTIRHGVGTFVAKDHGHLSAQLESMLSLSALIREKGGEARVDSLKIRRTTAGSEIAIALDIAPASPIVQIARRRLIGNKPLAVAYDYISLVDAEWKLPVIETFDGGSIYGFMAEKLSQQVVSSQASIAAVSANAKHARLLHVKTGFPLLLMREIQFDAERRRALYSVIYHNSSLMEFTLKRPGARP